jgi:hypothetical protein
VIHPDETALFFGIDVLKSYDDYYEGKVSNCSWQQKKQLKQQDNHKFYFLSSEIHAYISNANGKEKSQPNVEETSFIKVYAIHVYSYW